MPSEIFILHIRKCDGLSEENNPSKTQSKIGKERKLAPLQMHGMQQKVVVKEPPK